MVNSRKQGKRCGGWITLGEEGVIERSRKENKGEMLAQIKGLGRDRVRGLKNIRV